MLEELDDASKVAELCPFSQELVVAWISQFRLAMFGVEVGVGDGVAEGVGVTVGVPVGVGVGDGVIVGVGDGVGVGKSH
jgi:hypothetical protein